MRILWPCGAQALLLRLIDPSLQDLHGKILIFEHAVVNQMLMTHVLRTSDCTRQPPRQRALARL
jgi:hypothetical protein